MGFRRQMRKQILPEIQKIMGESHFDFCESPFDDQEVEIVYNCVSIIITKIPAIEEAIIRISYAMVQPLDITPLLNKGYTEVGPYLLYKKIYTENFKEEILKVCPLLTCDFLICRKPTRWDAFFICSKIRFAEHKGSFVMYVASDIEDDKSHPRVPSHLTMSRPKRVIAFIEDQHRTIMENHVGVRPGPGLLLNAPQNQGVVLTRAIDQLEDLGINWAFHGQITSRSAHIAFTFDNLEDRLMFKLAF